MYKGTKRAKAGIKRLYERIERNARKIERGERDRRNKKEVYTPREHWRGGLFFLLSSGIAGNAHKINMVRKMYIL